jgi:hypothetical protein
MFTAVAQPPRIETRLLQSNRSRMNRRPLWAVWGVLSA